MIKLEEFRNGKFQIDDSKLGKIIGGVAPNTGSGEMTLAAGTPNETTIEWSSDTENYDQNGDLTSGTYHREGSENDPKEEVA